MVSFRPILPTGFKTKLGGKTGKKLEFNPQIHANLGKFVLAKTSFREMNSFLGRSETCERSGFKKYKFNTRLTKLFS